MSELPNAERSQCPVLPTMWHLHGASPVYTLQRDHASRGQVLRPVRESTSAMTLRTNPHMNRNLASLPVTTMGRIAPARTRHTVLAALALWCICTATWAQIKVENAWVRATVPQQQATGAFMKLTSSETVKLVAITTTIAKTNEIHEMKMEGNVMKMRAHPNGLDIPANTPVELKSGGYHLMIMELEKTIKAGDTVPLQLEFTNAKGIKQVLTVSAKAAFKDPYKP